MKSTKQSLVMALALAIGATGIACSSDPDNGGSGGSGGSTGGSGGSTGGRGGSTGGSGGSTGGSGGSTGGSGGSTGGSGGSTGGSGGSTGGSGGSTGGSGGSTGGSGGSTGGSGGSKADGGTPDKAGDGGGSEGGGTGAFTVTIDHIPHPTRAGRLCFKPEASNSGGNKSPKIDWTAPPAGTKSIVVSVYDMSNTTPHQIVCNIMPDVMGRPADAKATIPPGAQSSTGHSKPMNAWYGPGAGAPAHAYEIRVWALSTPMLEGGCGTSGAAATRAVYAKLKNAPATLVLASDGKVLHGNVNGGCD